jgi:class 3 adenylate cyclase
LDRGARKTVTVVFADIVSWTELGERLDPETVRQLMARYFQTLRRVLERHGGTVEKFIGDAVMAVFGIPVVHEDDALRATHAAFEITEALRKLNEELKRRWGVRLEVRIGVNTGEVVADDPSDNQAFATGDAVNVAARLQQAAQPGETLIGEATRRLVGDAVVVVEVPPGSPGARRRCADTTLVTAFRASLRRARRGASAPSRNVRALRQGASVPTGDGPGRGGNRQVTAGP